MGAQDAVGRPSAQSLCVPDTGSRSGWAADAKQLFQGAFSPAKEIASAPEEARPATKDSPRTSEITPLTTTAFSTTRMQSPLHIACITFSPRSGWCKCATPTIFAITVDPSFPGRVASGQGRPVGRLGQPQNRARTGQAATRKRRCLRQDV